MNWQEFEDRLKAEAQAQHTPVDTDALWLKIRAKKRRRVLLFWWCFGLAALAGGGWLAVNWFASNQSQFSLKTTSTIAADTNSYDKNPSVQAIDSAYLIQTKNIRDTNKTSANHRLKIASQTPDDSNKSIKSSISNPRSISTAPANKPLWKNNSDLSPIGQLSTKADNNSVAVFSDKINSSVLELNNQLYKGTPDSLSKNTLNLSSSDTSEKNKSPIFADSFSTTNQTLLPWLPKSMMLLVPPSGLNKPLLPVFSPVAEKRPTNKPNHLYIGLRAGYYGWKIQTDSARTGEKPLTVLQTGLQVQLPLGPSWAVLTGIQYAQYNAVFRWTRQWEAIRETPVLSYYVNGNIDTAFTNVLYRYDRQVQHYNRLQTISVPLDIQYRISLKNWTLSPSAGLQVQISQRANGVILNGEAPDAQVYPIIYQRAFNVGLRCGLSLEIPLGPRTRFVVEPAAMLDLSRRTKSIYPAERFQQWGLNVGMMRRW